MSLATRRPETQRKGLLPASRYIIEYRRISKNMYIIYFEVTWYILRYSQIFFDVACDWEAWNSKSSPPTRFAVYHRILKNICEYVYHLFWSNVVYSNIFSDILQCRLRRGGLKPKGRSYSFNSNQQPFGGFLSHRKQLSICGVISLFPTTVSWTSREARALHPLVYTHRHSHQQRVYALLW